MAPGSPYDLMYEQVNERYIVISATTREKRDLIVLAEGVLLTVPTGPTGLV